MIFEESMNAEINSLCPEEPLATGNHGWITLAVPTMLWVDVNSPTLAKKIQCERTSKSSETDRTKICDPFRLGQPLFICQTSNLDQNHVEG